MHSWCIAGHLILPSDQERAKTDKNFNLYQPKQWSYYYYEQDRTQ